MLSNISYLLCTDVWGEGTNSMSCSKICLVKVYPRANPEGSTKVFMVLVGKSLGKSFILLGQSLLTHSAYAQESLWCLGEEPLDPWMSRWMDTYLKSLSNYHNWTQTPQIFLQLGSDILCVHKFKEQLNGPKNAPYSKQLDLGWDIIGVSEYISVSSWITDHRPIAILYLFATPLNTNQRWKLTLWPSCI